MMMMMMMIVMKYQLVFISDLKGAQEDLIKTNQLLVLMFVIGHTKRGSLLVVPLDLKLNSVHGILPAK